MTIRALPARWSSGDAQVAMLRSDPGRTDQRVRCLADLLGCAVQDIVMTRAPRGKPILAWPHGAACSFAHRDGVSLVGAAWGGGLGVDLEVVRDDLPLCDVAEAMFSRLEADWVRALPAARRALGFTALWAAKEAVLKAGGQGIVDGLGAAALEGDAFMPLIDGADRIDLHLPGRTAVQLRYGSIPGDASAIACVARLPTG